MQTLTLAEYQDHPIDFPLSNGQVAALEAARIAVKRSGVEGQDSVLSPSSSIGAVHTGGLSIVIRPKIPIHRVMFLVAYAIDPKNWRRDAFNLRREPEVLESIVLAFAHHTRQAVRRGLLQGYRREEEALQTVRGRIRFDEQIRRRFGVPLPIEVSFDEFTEDITENRLLKAALHRLAHLPVRSAQARREVLGLRPVFNSVSLDSFRRGAPQVQYTRLNGHYRSAVELARLIIDNSSLELFHGQVTGASFLLDMNQVFERFLYIALGEALQLPQSQWQTQVKLALDEAGAIDLYPDLVWRSGSLWLFVGDAKYKNVSGEKVPNADIYQMLAYCTAAALSYGLLIYAKDEEADPGEYVIRNANKTIEVDAIDLSGQPEDILAEVGRIAERIKGRALGGPGLRTASTTPASARQNGGR